MSRMEASRIAGETLRRLIRENYATQQDFADDYKLEIRQVSRYVNEGISKVNVIQELAEFFQVDMVEFFRAPE